MTGRADVVFDARRVLPDDSRTVGSHEAIVRGIWFEVDPHVFSPCFFESTHAFADMLPSLAGMRFLDIGTGCGALAVLAAYRGASSVTASDISPAAVANARRNVARHQLDEIVTVVESDVYDGLPPGSSFDAIFWNAPWVFIREGYRPGSILERAFCDPGYASIRRFFEGAARLLSPGGSVMIGLGSFGDIDRILALADNAGLEQVHCESRRSASPPDVDFSLHRFRPTSSCPVSHVEKGPRAD